MRTLILLFFAQRVTAMTYKDNHHEHGWDIGTSSHPNADEAIMLTRHDASHQPYNSDAWIPLCSYKLYIDTTN